MRHLAILLQVDPYHIKLLSIRLKEDSVTKMTISTMLLLINTIYEQERIRQLAVINYSNLNTSNSQTMVRAIQVATEKRKDLMKNAKRSIVSWLDFRIQKNMDLENLKPLELKML
jgi:hypothetical protein